MKYLALALSLSLLLPGCSQDRQTELVEFKAQAGDSAKYWMKTKSNIKLESLDVEQASLALLHYQVDKVDDKVLKFSVVPELIQLSGNRNNFHSARPNDRKQEFRQLMSAGFDITLSSKTGELLSLSGKNAEFWQQVVEKSGDTFVDAMKNSLNSPGFVRQIPAKVGEILPLTEVGIHATELEVVKVTDDQLTLQINSADEQTKLYGKVILNRDNGWIEKLALASVKQIEFMGVQGTAHSNMLMQRFNSEELRSFIPDIITFVGSDYWFDLEHTEQAITEYIEPTAKELFKFTQGELRDNNNTFFTKLLLTDGQITPAGEIWFKDVRASSSRQPGLEVQLIPTLGTFMFPSEDGTVLEQEFLPLGWLAKGDLDKIDKITATALYHPAQLKTYSFAWSPDKTVTHQMGQLSLTITPLAGTTDKFAIDTYSGDNEFLLPIFGGLEGKVQQYVVPNVGPEWLTDDDKFTTSLNQTSMLLNVTNDADTVTFYINKLSSEPAFEQKLEWHLE